MSSPAIRSSSHARSSGRRTTALRPFRLVVLPVLLLGAAGCVQYRITVPDSDPTDTQYHTQTMHAWFWGMSMDPQVLSAECEGEGINDVTIEDNLGYDLIGVITLGIWKPIDVKYRCHAPGAGSGSVLFPEDPLNDDDE